MGFTPIGSKPLSPVTDRGLFFFPGCDHSATRYLLPRQLCEEKRSIMSQTQSQTKIPSHSKTRTLLECAIMIALGTILAQIKLFELPQGGSVTLCSMLPFMLISFRHGIKWGLLTGFVNSLLQMLIGGLYPPPAGTALAMFGEIMLDYVLAFTLLGLAGVFGREGKPGQVTGGVLLTCLLRFLCSFVSGFLIWASIAGEGIGAVIYSLGYNAEYMVPETILTLVVALLIRKIRPDFFRRQGAPVAIKSK